MANPPKPLILGTPAGGNTPAGTGGAPPPPLRVTPAPLHIQPPAAAPTAPPAPARGAPPPASFTAPARPPAGLPSGPRTLSMGGATPQQHSAVDQLVATAVASDPELERIKHRLRPRIQTLIAVNQNTILCWGEENLAVAQRESVVHARLAQRMSQLSVSEWLHKCAEASTAPPAGWTAVFKRPEGPAFYEAKLRQLQTEIGPMLTEYARLVSEIRPELEDLRLDAAALAAVAPRHTDPTEAMMVSNRLRTLVTGQQTAAQLLQSAENARMTLAQHCQNMDQLLSVTLPAWRIAEASR